MTQDTHSPMIARLFKSLPWLALGLLVFLGALFLLKPDTAQRLVQRLANRGNNVVQAATGQPVLMGIQPVSATRVQELFPEVAQTPMVLVFSSQFCMDCKALKPKLRDMAAKTPWGEFVFLDIQQDREAHAAVFEAFQPAMVPLTVFIGSDGKIQQVLAGVQSEATLAAATEQLRPTEAASAAVKVATTDDHA